MNKISLAVFCCMLSLVAGCASISSSVVDETRFHRPIRLACVGDSITAGSGTKDRTTQSYPAQLAALLGPKWDVHNFGVSGATLLNHANKPYTQQAEYQQALAFDADVVVIKLGTNDSKTANWATHKSEFEADYAALIARFAAGKSHPRIYLCRPIPSFPPGNYTIQPAVIAEEIVPLVDRVAVQSKLPVIDLFHVLEPHPEMVPDHVHPNADGARLIARAVYRAIKGNEPPAP
jgi:lysophospholipase L1-like esterase